MDEFLSSNTQDFIEVFRWRQLRAPVYSFLSSNTQDFIEVLQKSVNPSPEDIPEL